MDGDDDFLFINRIRITHEGDRVKVYIRRLGEWFMIFDRPETFNDTVTVTVPMMKRARSFENVISIPTI